MQSALCKPQRQDKGRISEYFELTIPSVKWLKANSAAKLLLERGSERVTSGAVTLNESGRDLEAMCSAVLLVCKNQAS
jgi:hypothetical protein